MENFPPPNPEHVVSFDIDDIEKHELMSAERGTVSHYWAPQIISVQNFFRANSVNVFSIADFRNVVDKHTNYFTKHITEENEIRMNALGDRDYYHHIFAFGDNRVDIIWKEFYLDMKILVVAIKCGPLDWFLVADLEIFIEIDQTIE